MMPFTSNRMPSPLRLWALVALATVLAIVLAVMIAQQGRDESEAVPGADATSAAKVAVARLISFDDGKLREELKEESDLLTDDYRDAYAKKFVELTGEQALEAGTTVKAAVKSIGVVEGDGDVVRLLAYVSVAISVPDGETTEPVGLPVRVEMQDVDGQWLVSGVKLL